LGWGQGRVWPLLTGERAHYELAAGNDIASLIETYERFATMGQMLPEQVWDERSSPTGRLQLGKPAGSAVPLVWAHAEYLKLLRSALDGKVFDRIEPVYARYSEPEGRKTVRRGLEIFTFRRPIQRIQAGETLRIVDANRFVATWSTDQWKTVNTTQSHGMGSAGFSVDISTTEAMAGGELSWTLQWTDGDRWLGYNVNVKIETS
jgi:glucoamylase